MHLYVCSRHSMHMCICILVKNVSLCFGLQQEVKGTAQRFGNSVILLLWLCIWF